MDHEMSKAEFLMEDGHDYSEERANEDLERVHAVYEDVLSALAASCIKHGVLLNKDEIKIAMDGVCEALSNEACNAMDIIPSASCSPYNSKQLIDKAHTRIIDSIRPPQIDALKVVMDMLRPATKEADFTRIFK